MIMPRFRVRLMQLARNEDDETSCFSFEDPEYENVHYVLKIHRGARLTGDAEYIWYLHMDVESDVTDVEILSLALTESCDHPMSVACQANGSLPTPNAN